AAGGSRHNAAAEAAERAHRQQRAEAAQRAKREARAWNPFKDSAEAAVYEYANEDGRPLFEVVRFELTDPSHPVYPDKTFRQRRFEPGHPKAGRYGCPPGFAGGLGDVPPVLFRRGGVRGAAEAGRTVYVVEGEKDVETLEAWGHVATCNPMGASPNPERPKWDATLHAPPLRGADVVVI